MLLRPQSLTGRLCTRYGITVPVSFRTVWPDCTYVHYLSCICVNTDMLQWDIHRWCMPLPSQRDSDIWQGTTLQNRLCTYWVHVLYAIPSHYRYTHLVMCRLCYCCWFCLQIAENFSEDLHRVASLINKVVTMCLYDIQVSELSCYLSLSLRGKPEWDPLWWDVGGCAYIRTILYVYVLIECHFTRLPSNVRESIPKSTSSGWRHCSWTVNWLQQRWRPLTDPPLWWLQCWGLPHGNDDLLSSVHAICSLMTDRRWGLHIPHINSNNEVVDTSVKLCQRVYCGRRAATEMEAV